MAQGLQGDMSSTRSHGTRETVELGNRFRQARLSRRLSIAQVSQALHMAKHHIEALEAGDFSVFAAEIYVRGACLSYAAFLGISQEVSEREVWRVLSAGRKPVPLKIHTAFSWFERLVTARLILWAALAVIGLMVSGYIVWQVQTFLQLPQLRLTEDLPAVTDELRHTVAGVAQAQAKVTVNGEVTVLSGDASFRVPLVLHRGINVVRIEAENAAGRKAVIEKHVLYTDSQMVR